MEPPVLYYRYVDVQYAPPVDEYGDYIPGSGGRLSLHLEAYQVHKATPKGVWLYTDLPRSRGGLTWVGKHHKKKFACPTIAEAYESYTARKKRQIRILETQIYRAKRALELSPESATRAYRRLSYPIDH